MLIPLLQSKGKKDNLIFDFYNLIIKNYWPGSPAAEIPYWIAFKLLFKYP